MRSREMLRRLNRIAPVKEPDPLAELSALLDCASGDELLELRATLQRVTKEGCLRAEDGGPDMRHGREALSPGRAARQAKGASSDSQIGRNKKPAKGARGPSPR